MTQNCLRFSAHPRVRWNAILLLTTVAMMASACQPATPPPTPTVPPPTTRPTLEPPVEHQPIAGGPILLRDNIELRKVIRVGFGNIRLAHNPITGELYYLHSSDGLFRVKVTPPTLTSKVLSVSGIFTEGVPSGMVFGPDGTLYVVANRQVKETFNQAIIRKGVADADGKFTWETLASTEPYPMSGTQFDHQFNGIVVSPDGQWVFVNSGSRTDHGEVQNNEGAFPDLRETALTAKIFRLPATAVDLVLPNDEAALKAQGLLFASGTRNSYDPAFAPNGDLFAGDNSPDADYPDELNWLREGLHYGFPWRFGDHDNPQQFADYDSKKDLHLQQDFVAVNTGSYRNDPDFPKAPGAFTDGVINLGPAAAQYRGDDGKQHDAYAESIPLHTFTPHRSPLGLVFATDPSLPAALRSDDQAFSAFVLSWGAAGGTLSDKGQDLLHLTLTKQGDNYESVTQQIARGFKNPIDAVLIENRLYVLEWGDDGAIWELIFT